MTTTTPLTEPPCTDAAAASRHYRHPFRTELLRGFTPWAGTAFVAALAWALIATAPSWQGNWAETASVTGYAGALIGGPLVLGAGCWQGGRERRRNTVEMRATSARSPLTQLCTAALPLALWVAAGYALTVAVALLASWPYAYQDGFAPTVPLGTAAVLVACSVLGHVVGATVRWRLTAPVLAVAAYGVFGTLLTNLMSDTAHALGPRLPYSPGRELLAWWSPLLTAAWYLALATTAALAYAARRRAALVSLAVALAVACTLVQTVDSATRPDPRRLHQVCTSATVPQVCVNATRAGLLPEVTEALKPLTDRLKGVRNLPTRYEDLSRRPHADEAELPQILLGQELVRGEMADKEWFALNAAQALLAYDCPEPGIDTVADTAALRWLAPSRLRASMDAEFLTAARKAKNTKSIALLEAENAASERLAAMDPDDRRDWLGRYFATARDCARTPNEVPAL